MADQKLWFVRWSHRRNKVFYVNIKTRESSWIKPDGFIASEDEVKRITDWKTKRDLTLSAPHKEFRKGGNKRPLDSVSSNSDDDEKGFIPDDYLQVYSKKRQMKYYYNLRSKASQWKRPACLQAAETLQAIENTKMRSSSEEVNLHSPPCNGDAEEDEVIAFRSTLNAEAPTFELISKLNVHAQPFIPSCRSEPATPEPTWHHHKNGCKSDPQRRVVVKRRIIDPPDSPVQNSQSRISVRDRLSLQETRSEKTRTVFDRLGLRCCRAADEWLFEDTPSNVLVCEKDLSKVPYLPPTPEVELLRYSEVSDLRGLFQKLCNEEMGIEEPNEALNRWLLDRQLNCTEITDPVLSCSEKKSVSMYREIMQDLPVKYKLPRSTQTCTNTLLKYVNRFKDIAKQCKAADRARIEKQCQEMLDKNHDFSDTRVLISNLRSSCDADIVKHYHSRVEDLCTKMNTRCQEGALRVSELVKEEFSDVLPVTPSHNPSTKLVGCRPAMPQISDEHLSRTSNVTECIREKQCRISYKDFSMTLNLHHYTKLEKLYASTSLASSKDKNLFNSRVWCLLKRYKMLRSSMAAGKLILQENFGLHAALPRQAFELLCKSFHVTFECFASPFNCHFGQYCSAFPDIDCYFGSRGSFFDLKPKSGSFQANPPFSEEIMLEMANHMILLLDESRGPLMFVIFIPDWKEPVTPAIPKLKKSEYCTHNILLASGAHQYISGNQHVQSVSHYNAVHGTQVFVLQNDEARGEWPVTPHHMDRLEEAMCTNWT